MMRKAKITECATPKNYCFFSISWPSLLTYHRELSRDWSSQERTALRETAFAVKKQYTFYNMGELTCAGDRLKTWTRVLQCCRLLFCFSAGCVFLSRLLFLSLDPALSLSEPKIIMESFLTVIVSKISQLCSFDIFVVDRCIASCISIFTCRRFLAQRPQSGYCNVPWIN